jgi:hypothetical protein
MGTPDYLAPEQARNPTAADSRSDLYALGCTLYQLLTGQPPFPAGTTREKLLAHQDLTPRPIHELRPEVSPPVADLVTRLLAKDVRRRPASPAEVASALAEAMQPTPPRSRRRSWVWWAAAGCLGLLVVVLGLLALRPAIPQTEANQKPAEEKEEKQPPESAIQPESDLLTAEQRAAQLLQRREEIVAWLGETNRWGAKGEVYPNVTKTINTALARHAGVQVLLGSGLTKANRPALFCLQPGGCFQFELPEGADGRMALKPTATRIYSYRAVAEERRASPRILLSDLVIDNAEALPFQKRVTGSVKYQFVKPCENPPFVRLHYYPYPGRVRCSGMFYPKLLLEGGEGRIAFDMPEVSEKQASQERMLVVYVEMATRVEGKTTVESNTLAKLVWPVGG